MSNNKYLVLKLEDQELDFDVNSDFPIVFDYQLEDVQDFQRKKSSESLGIKIPATKNNQKLLNSFHNTSVEDTSTGQYFKSIRKFTAEANGVEVFSGKAIPKKAIKKNGKVVRYELNAFGNNGDWMIDFKDLTLFDILKKITLEFTKSSIENSWSYDGRNENQPYVFAPVKYGGAFDPVANNDNNYALISMRPSISKFWIIYWAFQSLGYKIKSNFLDSDYFRRQVLPWTFGNFLTSEGTKYQIHQFMAKSDVDRRFDNSMDDFVDLNVLDIPTPPAYDNNNTIVGGDYNYLSKEMRWKYNTPHYGPLEVMFSMNIFYDYKIDLSSEVEVRVHWFKNGIQQQVDLIAGRQAPTVGYTSLAEVKTIFFATLAQEDDVVSAKVFLHLFKTKTATVARCILNIQQFQIDYFRIPIGGQIKFDSYLNLQKYKFLDFLKGEVDLFDLNFQTDPINKEVLIEPSHDYYLGNNKNIKNEGYFTKDFLSWTEKEDQSVESIVEIYDDNAREFVFKFKDDSNDGALKLVQDRYKITLAAGKYVFDERFKAEKKDFENRFYSATMHYFVDEFLGITGQAPQMICLVPENISNTSSSEAGNTFLPKSAYYKGLVSNVGGWRFDGQDKTDYPFMFAVNYKPGGENDPIISYTDEKIGNPSEFVVGTGLLKRFFWQRLAIMNNGQWLTTKFRLNNTDITNWYHRERIDLNGELFELLSIKNFNPLKENSIQTILRKWVPITIREKENTYPTESSILQNAVVVLVAPPGSSGNEIDKVFDTQYNRLICLYTDIPR